MKELIILFTLFLTVSLNAQNLVPNPSFETYAGELPFVMNNGDLDIASSWFITSGGPGGAGGTTPDYINLNMPLLLFGGDTYEFQTPNSGFGMVDLITCTHNDVYFTRESFQVKLKEPMQAGEIYQVSFYLQKTDPYAVGGCFRGSDELGVYFHTDTVYQIAHAEDFEDPYKLDNYIELWSQYTNEFGNTAYEFTDVLQEPDIQLNEVIEDEEMWVLVSDTVYAHKAYEFMVFSRFSELSDIVWEDINDCDGLSTFSTMNVDDVSVHLVNEEHIEADAGVDATICNGDSLQIGTTEYEDYMYWWSPNEEIALDTFGYVNPGMPWVKPTVTTTYTLTQKDFAFEETTDEVTITVVYCPGFSVGETVVETIKIFPNPAKNFIEIESGHAIDSWKVLDVLGKKVASSKYLESSTNLIIDVSSFDAGLYFLEMELDGIQVIKQLMIE